MTINSNITISIIAKNKRNRGINANRTFVITYGCEQNFEESDIVFSQRMAYIAVWTV